MNSWTTVYLVLISLILCFDVFSNVLVIVAVISYRKLRTVTHVLICNLALSGILLAVVFMPQKLHDMSHPEHYDEGVAVCKFIQGFPVFVITSSCYTLVLISFERRRAILEPYKDQLTLTQTLKLLPAVWIGGFIVAFPTMLEYTVVTIHSSNNTTTSICSNLFVPRILTVMNCLTVATLSFVLPLILMSYNYTKLIMFVNRKCKQVNTVSDRTSTQIIGSPDVRSTLPTSHLFRNRLKIIKMLSLMASGFAICWMPFVVLFVYRKLSGMDASLYSSSEVTLVLNSMMSFNTAYNVILYVIYNKMFRQSFKHMIRCTCKENVTLTTVS